MILQKVLRQLLKDNDVNASQLARATGISVKTVHNWLSGQPPRSIEHIKKVAEHFNVSLDYICFGKEMPSAEQNKFQQYEDEINAGIFEVILRRVKK